MNPVMDAATKALGSKPGKKALHLHIEPTENDGFIAHHQMHEDGMPTGRLTKHSLSSLKNLIEHVKTHYTPDANLERVKEEAGGEGKGQKEIKSAENEAGE